MIREFNIASEDLLRVLPKPWLEQPNIRSVLISIYQSIGVPKEQFAKGMKTLGIGQVFALVSYCSPDITPAAEPMFTSVGDGSLTVRLTTPPRKKWPEGAYTFFLAPSEAANGGKLRNDAEAFRLTEVAVALAGLLLGRNFVYNRVLQMGVSLRPLKVDRYSSVRVSPIVGQFPDVSHTKLEDLCLTGARITQLPWRDRNRVELSLRWAGYGHSGEGVDDFLRMWIALETLGMPTGTNYRPIVEKLAEIYKLDYETSRRRFRIGLVYKLRSTIVHAGARAVKAGGLIPYLEAIYCDILRHDLGQPPLGRALEVIERADFDLKGLLGA